MHLIKFKIILTVLLLQLASIMTVKAEKDSEE